MRLSVLCMLVGTGGVILGSCSSEPRDVIVVVVSAGSGGAGSGGDSAAAGKSGDGGRMGSGGDLGGEAGATLEAGAGGAAGDGGANSGGMSGAGNGGASSGGADSGGMSGADAGGSTNNVAGNGGDASGGSSGSGGANGSTRPTAGCGKDPGQQLGEYVAYTVPITGETLGEPDTTHDEREIWVRLPDDYDPNTPYRIVYLTVGCGGPGTSGYPLWDDAQGGDPNAIYVGLSRPDPPPDPPSQSTCYDTRGGLDSIEWESLEKDHYFVSERFCIDDNKVYTGGYSGGAWLSNMYSCYFGGIPEPPRKFLPNVALRGAMAVAGCWVDGNPPCNGPVGGLWIHDESDMAPNAYSCAQEQRDRVLAQNGCAEGADGPTETWEVGGGAGECVKYTNCPAEYPVIFCTTQGRGHGASNDIAIPEFTRMIHEMEAAAP